MPESEHRETCVTPKDVPEDKRLKVCVFGASFDTGNLGVSALAESSIKCILSSRPDAQITMLEGSACSNGLLLNVDGRDVKLNVYPVRFCKNIFVRNHFLKLMFYSLLARLSRSEKFKQKMVSKERCLESIAQADYVIDINAGDSFSDLYGKKRFILGFLRKWLVLMMGKKLVFLPQSYGPFKSGITRRMAEWLIKHSAVAYARDRAGYDYLKRVLGANSNHHKIGLFPDVAFGLDACRPVGIEKDLPVLFREDNRPVVGLNVSGLLYNGGYNKSNMFGLKADYSELTEKIIKVLVDDYGAHIVLVPHVFPPPRFEVESDISACMDLYNSIDRKYASSVFLSAKRYDHKEIKYIIGKCDFFIGARMHSCIAAMSQCVPAVGLAYSDKFTGVFEQAGNQQNVIDLRGESVKEIVGQIKAAFRQHKELNEHLKKVMPNIRSMLMRVVDDI